MKRLFTYSLTGFFISCQLLVSAQNVLTNGSFEQDFTSWLNLAGGTSAATYSLSTSDKYEGNIGMQVVVTTSGANAYDIQAIHSGWNANRGKEYKVSVFAKAAVAGGTVKLVNQDTSYAEKIITLATDWKEYTWLYTPVESSLQFKLQFPSIGTFFIDNITISETNPGPPPVVKDSLKVLAAKCGINIGTAVADGPLQVETNYINTIKQQYNIVTAENVMKMSEIRSTETNFNFAAADRLVNFAVANNIKVRGHTLLWHSQLPVWVTAKTWTKATLLAYLKDYITIVVGRYKGKIAEWDVANEFFSDDAGNPLRNSLWISTIGVEVLDSAFVWAHQADPSAKLFYNDYSTETMNTKSNQVFELVKGLQMRGVPIHGVGLQTHRAYNETPNFFADLDRNIKRIGELGLKVAITELDLYVPLPVQNGNYETQGHTYAEMLRTAIKNAPVVETFVTWGFTDKYSWIPDFYNNANGDALPFNTTYNPKPAFDSIASVLKKSCLLMTGNDDLSMEPQNVITCYPNPFSETIMVKGNGQIEYSIYDLNMKKIEEGKGENAIEVGSGLKSGFYTLKTYINKETQTFKIVKKRTLIFVIYPDSLCCPDY